MNFLISCLNSYSLVEFLKDLAHGSRTWQYIEIACASLADSDVIGLGCDLCSGNV